MTTHIELARYIDHTALKPDTTEEQIRQLCVEADELGFAAVCVMPYWVPLCSLVLDELGASLAIATTIGFPNGSHQTVVKVAETKKAIYDGAQEIDMVINVGALRSGHRAVLVGRHRDGHHVGHDHGALVKVIIETSLLNDDQKRLACELAGEAGVDFVKTSTGFAGGGATVADIELMRESSPKRMQIKASGGIRDAATAIRMIAAGASRIGTSSGVSIVRESVDA